MPCMSKRMLESVLESTAANTAPVLSHCVFTNETLAGIDFLGADLHYAEFINCDLRGVSFDGCQLDFALFKSCDLSFASLSNASIDFASFCSVKMIDTVASGVRWEHAFRHSVVPCPIDAL